MKYFLIFFTFLLCLGANAQTSEYEKQEQIAQYSKNNDERLLALLWLVRNVKNEKTIYYCEEGLSLSTKLNVDTLEFIFLKNLGELYLNIDNERAKEILLRLVKKFKGNNLKSANFNNDLGLVYMRSNDFDSSIYYFRISIDLKNDLLKKDPDDKPTQISLGRGLTNLGALYVTKSDYEKAIKIYFQALDIYQKISDTNKIGLTYLNIGVIYYYYKDWINAKQYYQKALAIAKNNKIKKLEASALTNLGTIEQEQENYIKADSLYKEALIIRFEIGPESSVAGIYENMAIIAQELDDFDLALNYLNKSLKIKIKENNDNGLASIYNNLGNLYIRKKDYNNAEEALLKAEFHAKQANVLEKLLQIYSALSALYEQKNNFSMALKYHKEFKIIDDSIHSIKTLENISLYQKRFETAELERNLEEYKQKQNIAQLNQEKQRLNNRLLFLIIILLLFGSAAIVYFINSRRKSEKQIFDKNNELNQQKMLELVKEQDLISVNSFIKGQEKERSRVAAELHDRLGSILSTVKLHFSSLEPFTESNEELAESFSYAISLLDRSVAEVRMVSHNLAKEILTDFGLLGAMNNLAEAINSAGVIKVIFIQSNYSDNLKYDAEIEIYRIMQELITNAIKHSKASELVIQFIMEETMLSITVEDDGVGFNIDNINKNGLGLTNILQRTSAIHGRYTLDSTPGRGTSFFFEFPLENIIKQK